MENGITPPNLYSMIADEIYKQREEILTAFVAKFVIVGRLEYDLLIEDMKNHPGILEDGMKVFGLSVVPDFQSSSRVTVTHEIGMRSNRLRKKAGL